MQSGVFERGKDVLQVGVREVSPKQSPKDRTSSLGKHPERV